MNQKTQNRSALFSWLVAGLSSILGFMRVLLKFVLFLVLFVAAAVLFFFAMPEISFRESEVAYLLKVFLPEHAEVLFEKVDVRILKPEEGFFAKRVKLRTEGLCVRARENAVRFCAQELETGFVIGWGRESEESWALIWPALIKLDPILIRAGELAVDQKQLYDSREVASQKVDQGKGIDIFSYLRKVVLPRWNVFGSQVQFSIIEIITRSGNALSGRAGFVTDQDKNMAIFELNNWRRYSGEKDEINLEASATIEVKRPERWIRSTRWDSDGEPWRVKGQGSVKWAGKRSAQIQVLADFQNWRSVKINLRSQLKNVFSLREVRFRGHLREDDLDGHFSMKIGEFGDLVQALEFVDCNLTANLKTKLGGLKCGPETVTIATREFQPLTKTIRDLFVFHPELLFQATRISFGEKKAIDFQLGISLKHQNLVNLRGDLLGHWGAVEDGAAYFLRGKLGLVSESFQRVVKLLARTRYSIPAPLNALDGRIGLDSEVDISDQRGGLVRYQFRSDLQSRHQQLDLRLQGETVFRRENSKLEPYTQAQLLLDRVHLAAPRFDLRAPPRLRPDSRFTRIEGDPFADRDESVRALNLRLHVKTTARNAIRISSNLLKEPLPIELDLVYDDRPKKIQEQIQPPSRGPASINRVLTTSETRIDQRERGEDPSELAPIRGHVLLGTTPVDLFKRNAVLNELRIDFLENGERRMNGRLEVNYLDYRIQILLLGKVTDPRVIFASEPPLDDNQVISVLLFGRPLEELGADERTSVFNFNSALVNAALGLTSLYFLASTPIESISYDPSNGSITARVGLGGGASIEVGARGEGGGAIVGFNKRLAPNWVFRTEVERLGVAGRRTISALVEWVRRF